VEARRESEDAAALLGVLGLADRSARPVIVVCGGAALLTGEHLRLTESVLGPAVAWAARDSGAAVVDGGSATGVMAVVGEASEVARSADPLLVGVAPRGRIQFPGSDEEQVDLESHHTHFVLAHSDEWGGERRLLFRVAARLAGTCRIVVVLAGGGPQAAEEALEAVRRRWPIIVLKGTGGLADELAETAPVEPTEVDAAVRHRILRDGDVQVFAERDPAALARRLGWELHDAALLKDAWQTFAAYDKRANALRDTFKRFQWTVIGVGIAGTTFALLHEALDWKVLRWPAVAAPAILAVLVALATRFAAGKRWVLLRAAAETVKSEIYGFRTGTGRYAASLKPLAACDVLAKRLNAIDAQLMETEVSGSRLDFDVGHVPPDSLFGTDDGVSPLDAKRYIELRVDDQLGYYRGKVAALSRLRTWLQTVSLTVGAGGTILAAAGAELWIALTTAVSAGAFTYLSTLQVDQEIIGYNQSAAQLAGVRRDWLAVSDPDELEPAFGRMVAAAELSLSSELSGWVQRMRKAIEAYEAQLAAELSRSDPPDAAQAGGTT
jgi:hypothetical protein